jgi:hypothetical protein
VWTDVKWPLWVWFVGGALAVAIGGGLGNWVGQNLGSQRAEASPAVKQPVEETRTATPAAAKASVEAIVVEPAAKPEPEIAIAPKTIKPPAKPVVRRAAQPPTPKRTPPPIKRKPCNVYEHMDGC